MSSWHNLFRCFDFLLILMILLILVSGRLRYLFRRVEGSHFIFQNKLNNCGNACIQMVGYKLGKNYDNDFLSSRIKLSNFGTSMLDIKLFFEEEGYLAEGYHGPIDEFYNANGNIIASVHFFHFVVIDTASVNGIIVKDPAVGIVRVPSWIMRYWYRGTYLKIDAQKQKC